MYTHTRAHINVYAERERDNVVYWKTNGKINNNLQYINAYAYMYTDIHIYIYIHIHMHLYTHTAHTYTYACICTRMYR